MLYRLLTRAMTRNHRSAARFARDDSANAILEAAILFPLLATLFIGISEISEADLVTRRLSGATGTAADLVARQSSVTTNDLTTIKDNLLDEIIKPFATDKFGVIITSVETDQANRSTVGWSFARGGTVVPYAAGGAYTLPAGLAEPGGSIIVAEGYYSFRSTLSTMIFGTVTLDSRSYSPPRVSVKVARQ